MRAFTWMSAQVPPPSRERMRNPSPAGALVVDVMPREARGWGRSGGKEFPSSPQHYCSATAASVVGPTLAEIRRIHGSKGGGASTPPAKFDATRARLGGLPQCFG